MEANFWLGLALILTLESYATGYTSPAWTPATIAAAPSTTAAPVTAAAATAAHAGGSSGWGGSSGSSCNMTHCPSCPTGYHSYQEIQFGCTYRCLCELNGPTTQSSSRNLLMRILGIIQNNAVALEKMAHGVSDEADLAQDIEHLPHV